MKLQIDKILNSAKNTLGKQAKTWCENIQSPNFNHLFANGLDQHELKHN